MNTTTASKGPPSAGSSKLSRYTANNNRLVQYTPDTGVVRYLDFQWLADMNSINPGNNWIELAVVEKLDSAKVPGNTSVVGSVPGNTGNQKNGSLSNEIRGLVLAALLYLGF